MKKQLLVHLTEEEHEFLRVEAFETGQSMAGILREGLELYKNQKEEGKVTKELTFEEMVEQARERVTGSDYVKLMDKARHAATDSGIFTTDEKEDWDENSQYLVEDMEDVVQAFCDDYSIEKVFGIDPAEADDGAEAFCKRHGIRILG